jgi:hypothetical protein
MSDFRHVARRLGGLLGQIDDRIDDRLELAMAEHHRVQHHLFGELLGLRLHHHDGIGGAGHHQVEIALLHLGKGRVEDEIAVDETDPGGRDRPEERDARQRQRRGRRDHGDDVGIVLHVVRQHRGDDLRLALEALDEQRPDRPVDQPRHQRFLLGRPALALEIAAGDLAGGVGLFLVVDGEREEVEPRLGAVLGHHGGEHRRLAVGDEHRAVGLARHAAGFEPQGPAAPLQFLNMNFEHDISFIALCRRDCDFTRQGGVPIWAVCVAGPIAGTPQEGT